MDRWWLHSARAIAISEISTANGETGAALARSSLVYASQWDQTHLRATDMPKTGTDDMMLQAENGGDSLDNSGGPFRARTGDPLIKSQLLYQLS
jgi:hypothetical protein